jgi:hypothetical protein
MGTWLTTNVAQLISTHTELVLSMTVARLQRSISSQAKPIQDISKRLHPSWHVLGDYGPNNLCVTRDMCEYVMC